jgi:hypothetical protein
MSDKIHNKSGKSQLSFLLKGEDHTEKLFKIFDERIACGHMVSGLCRTQCILLANKKGTVSLGGNHACFGYQLVALRKFGLESLLAVPPSKDGDSLTISHLCGTRNCCNPDHLILEAKRINDERTHCHFSMNQLLAKAGPEFLEMALHVGLCPHQPQCGTNN